MLYNTTNGILIARGNFEIPRYNSFDSNSIRIKSWRFEAMIIKFYEGGKEIYRVFDDKGNEVLDSKYVGNGKKVEILTYESMGIIMPLRLRIDKFHSDCKGILHIIFNEDGTSDVIEVIPPTYDEVDLNLYNAVKDNKGKRHYPTYTATKDGKKIHFTFAGERIRPPKIS